MAPPALAGTKLELLQELMDTLEKNNERLIRTGKRKYFKDHKEKYDYILEREDTEQTLKVSSDYAPLKFWILYMPMDQKKNKKKRRIFQIQKSIMLQSGTEAFLVIQQ